MNWLQRFGVVMTICGFTMLTIGCISSGCESKMKTCAEMCGVHGVKSYSLAGCECNASLCYDDVVEVSP